MRTDKTAPRRRAALWFSALAALTLAAGGAGCGGDDSGGGATATTPAATGATGGGGASQIEGLEPDAILAKSKEAAKAAKSAKVVGEIRQGTSTTKLDVTMTPGKGGFGTIEQGGARIDLVVTGQSAYVKPDAKALASFAGGNAEAAKLLAGKWIKAPASDSRLGPLTQILNLPAFVDQALSPDGTVTKADGKDVDGTPTVALTSKGAGANGGGTLYIADEGPPYPLLLEPAESSDDEGQIRFSEWDRDVTVEEPPADEVIDISKLPGS